MAGTPMQTDAHCYAYASPTSPAPDSLASIKARLEQLETIKFACTRASTTFTPSTEAPCEPKASEELLVNKQPASTHPCPTVTELSIDDPKEQKIRVFPAPRPTIAELQEKLLSLSKITFVDTARRREAEEVCLARHRASDDREGSTDTPVPTAAPAEAEAEPLAAPATPEPLAEPSQAALDDIASGDVDSLSSFDLDDLDRQLMERQAAQPTIQDSLFEESKGPRSHSTPALEEPSTHSPAPAPAPAVALAPPELRPAPLREHRPCVPAGLSAPARPALLDCPPVEPHLGCPVPPFHTLVDETVVPVFSQAHRAAFPMGFRAPGPLLESRPLLIREGSVMGEEGILSYWKVFSGNTSWYVQKLVAENGRALLEIPCAERDGQLTELIYMSDSDFSAFILSDVVTTRLRRSAYVIYNGECVLGRMLGSALCLCRGRRCLRVLQRSAAEPYGLDRIRFGEDEIRLSCRVERDAWLEALSHE